MLNQKPKPRPPRIEKPNVHVDDETSHLWAVSYADFLMVLLSFFILFFSVDEQKKESIIQTIAHIGGNTDSPPGAGPGKGAGLGPGPGGPKAAVASLKTLLQQFNLRTEHSDENLILMFPKDIYGKGQVLLSKAHKEQLKTLLERLKPFTEKIELVFVGHTDTLPIVNDHGKFLNDNFDLSVLRASKALQFALKNEFHPDHLSAKGSASGRRNSRTLSLIIRPYKSTFGN